MSNKSLLFCSIAFCLALYTQCVQLTEVPGLHFDEAWQGMFAHRILTEKGFWPTSAMNSYTSPVIHYLIALFYKIFGASLFTLRSFFVALNLSALLLFASFLWRMKERLAVAWFILLWALLPLSIHNHRFYIEMTGLFGFLLALYVWGLALWRRHPRLSNALLLISTLLGIYSHILFIVVPLATVFIAALNFPQELKSKRARLLASALFALTIPALIRMGVGLKKASPFALAIIIAAIAALAQNKRGWLGWQAIALKLPRPLFFLSIPFLIAFVFLMWNGFWPFAQATGYLELWWLPVNLVLFLIALRAELREKTQHPLWIGFLATFLISSILIFKQSPRYYMIPLILAMMWCSLRLARLKDMKVQCALALLFIAWNLFAFEKKYIQQFQLAGATTLEFKLGPFHDNARDFRPFQKAYRWVIANNCQDTLEWVEDDRFLFPVELLKLTAPKAQGKCPWKGYNFFFSHIPNYDTSLNGKRNEFNTPPPPEAPNVKFLAHFPEWGDLAFWARRQPLP